MTNPRNGKSTKSGRSYIKSLSASYESGGLEIGRKKRKRKKSCRTWRSISTYIWVAG